MESKALSPQAAVTSAVRYLIEVLGDLEKPTRFTVEKLSLSEDKKTWTVVLGYESGEVNSNSLSVILGNSPRRYKKIEIDAIKGEGISLNTFNLSNN